MDKIRNKLLSTKIIRPKSSIKSKVIESALLKDFLKIINEEKIIKFLKLGTYLILPLLILTPEIRLTSPAIRLDEVLLLFMIFAYFALKLKRMTFKVSLIDYLFGALFISVIASILLGSLRDQFFFFNDFFEIIKLAKYYLLYRIIYAIDWDEGELKRIVTIAVISFIIAVAFSIAQYFDLFSVNNKIMPYFSVKNHIRSILNAGRVVGTFRNANVWALALGMPLIIIFSNLLKGFKNYRFIYKFAILFFLFWTITSVLMTMSRTSFVSNFIALSVISAVLVWHPFDKGMRVDFAKKVFKAFFIFIVISIISFTFITKIPNKKGTLNIAQRFEIGLNDIGFLETEVDGESESWSSRKEKWIDISKRATGSPIFGYGPSKSLRSSSNLPYTVDNEYLLYLYRYGLLGLLLYIGILFVFFLYSVLNVGHNIDLDDSRFVLNILALGVSVSYPLYNILAGSFYNFQLFPLFIIWGALNINILMKHES